MVIKVRDVSFNLIENVFNWRRMISLMRDWVIKNIYVCFILIVLFVIGWFVVCVICVLYFLLMILL